jgi:16S rRNA (cytosine967-C5)-methyltransferase
MLLYATCSVFRKENSGQVNSFLERHDDATAAGPDGAWGRIASPGRQILPGEEEMDGFYYAVLRKTR